MEESYTGCTRVNGRLPASFESVPVNHSEPADRRMFRHDPGLIGRGPGYARRVAIERYPSFPEEDPVDAIVLLKNDHKTVEKLFKDYEKLSKDETARPADKKEIVDEVVRELTTHAFIEETVFYPTAREAVPDTGEHVLESVEEHHVMAWILSELSRMDPSDERYDAKMTVLMENVRHHVEEEEQEWFPEVRKGLGRKRLQELGEELEAAKPNAPNDPLELMSASA